MAAAAAMRLRRLCQPQRIDANQVQRGEYVCYLRSWRLREREAMAAPEDRVLGLFSAPRRTHRKAQAS